jgi:hypothetical protein
MPGLLLTNELGRVWKEAVVAQLGVLSLHLPEGAEGELRNAFVVKIARTTYTVGKMKSFFNVKAGF